jgi:Cu-Zn family superoxide dismutase
MTTVVAVFNQIPSIQGHAVATLEQGKTRLKATFTHLPEGKHGFHIHRAGDLRGEGCQGACEHFHVGPPQDHGSKPGSQRQRQQRHTGDLGNIEQTGAGPCKYSYLIPDITPEDLLGRALIIHEDEDDLGLGDFPDSKTTGHSGKRIGCAIFGRASCSKPTTKTRKRR